MEPIKINIFGSCCSREIINYSEHFKVNAYVQQNPIHTLKSKSFPIDETEAISANNSAFIRRMVAANFNKTAIDLLFAQEADYLMIDFADCRFDYIEITEPEELKGVKIANTWNNLLTLESLVKAKKIKYEKIMKTIISDEEWEKYLDEFIEIIKQKWPEEKIIINEITFAEKYIADKEIKYYDKNGIELSSKPLIKKIEEMAKKKLPNALVLNRQENVFGNVKHPYGNIPLHYANYAYKFMVKQLEYLLNVPPYNIYQ